jgi:hypothetical protein
VRTYQSSTSCKKTLASKGLTTEPWTVPVCGSLTWPSSQIPQRKSRVMRSSRWESCTRFLSIRRRSRWSSSSKQEAMSPSMEPVRALALPVLCTLVRARALTSSCLSHGRAAPRRHSVLPTPLARPETGLRGLRPRSVHAWSAISCAEDASDLPAARRHGGWPSHAASSGGRHALLCSGHTPVPR